MGKVQQLHYLWHFILTGFFLTSLLPNSFGQWSFKPNYYQYDASVLSTNTVYRLLEDPYGFIWMISDKGILVFNGETFETIKIPGNEQEIVNVCRYKNTVYASSYAGKLYEIDMLSLAVKEILLPEPAASEATLFKIMNAIDDKLYLARGMGTFLILDLKKNYKPILISRWEYFHRYLIYGDLSATDLGFGNIWTKVLNDKMFAKSEIYEVHNKDLKVFYTAGEEYLKLKMVSSYLQEDSDLYVGFLQSGGVVKYRNYNSNSNHNISESILPDVEVGDILKDRKGNIWVSTIHDGVFVFFKEGKKVKKLHDQYKLYADDIWYIKYKNSVLDIGYKRLMVDQLKNGSFYKRWIGDTTINFNPVMSFHNYQNEATIFGSFNSYTTDNNRKKTFPYKDIYIYRDEIYATTTGTLNKFSKKLDFILSAPSDVKFNTMFPLPDSVYARGGSTGLYLNNIPTKITDRTTKVRGYNKDVLACTDNGLYIKRGEQYFHITEQGGLPDNQCVQIEYYGDRYYKLLTKRGLAYIDTASCKVAGVLNSQSIGNNTIIRHFDVENDTVWLATNKGIYVLNETLILNQKKDSILAYLYPEKLNNRSAKYTEQEFETKYEREKLVKMIIEVLNFSSNEYYISYQVEKNGTAVQNSAPVSNNSFFVNTSEPGTYTVKVFIGNDKNHIDKTLTYLLTITPLWYQYVWVKLLIAAIILFLLWLAIRSITRYVIKEKEKRLKDKYEKLQLQSQAFFTQLNPHFVFNALTPLQSHILKNEKIESLEYLDRFSSLMRDILKNSDQVETNLKKELNFIEKYIAIQQIRFSPPFSFELNVDPAIDPDNTSLPAMMLQPIIENAVEHGVKSKGAEGKIIVDINTINIQGKECVQIIIDDNGAGVTNEVLKAGHALYILQKRVQVLQKKDGAVASLTHEPGENSIGTRFKLVLPKTKTLWTL